MHRLLLAFFLVAGSVVASAQTSSADAPRSPVRVPGGVIAGQILTKVQPVYPQEAKDAHVSGAVVMRAIIGKDGTIKDLQVMSGPELLRQCSLDAVKQWTYKPYLLNGEPVEVETIITVTVNYSADNEPVKVSGNVLQGLLEKKVTAEYPMFARQNHISGLVHVGVLIGMDGRVEQAQVIDGPDELRAASLAAVKQYKYRPYLLNGTPVRVMSWVTVSYEIRN